MCKAAAYAIKEQRIVGKFPFIVGENPSSQALCPSVLIAVNAIPVIDL
jgi:hypothetical protein